MQGLLEAREELKPLLSSSNDRLKDLLFVDIALDSTVRTAIERGYEELKDAKPEVCTYLFMGKFHNRVRKDTKLSNWNVIFYCLEKL